MTSEERQIIKEKLFVLSAQVRFEGLIPLIDRLGQIADTNKHNPEFFESFVPLIEAMDDEIVNDRGVQEVLEDVTNQSGVFHQPDWDVKNVFQTAGDQFNFYIQKHMDPGVIVSIVLLVMNEKEKNDLLTGEAFNEYPSQLLETFQRLKIQLETEKLTAWFDCYGNIPLNWKPPLGQMEEDETIHDIISRAIKDLGNRRQQKFLPSFVNVRKINDPSQRFLLTRLRKNGCIVIIDALSLYHPDILTAFHRSLLDAYPRTSVVSIAPNGKLINIAREITVRINTQVSEMEFFKRKQNKEADYGFITEADDRESLQHWIETRAKELCPTQALKEGIYSHINNFSNLSESEFV